MWQRKFVPAAMAVLAALAVIGALILAGRHVSVSTKGFGSPPSPPPWPVEAAQKLRPTPPPGLTCDAPGRQPSSLVADPPVVGLRGQPNLLQGVAEGADAI